MWEEMGELVTWGMHKAGVLNGFSALVFSSECSSHSTRGTDKGRDWEKREPPTVGEDEV